MPRPPTPVGSYGAIAHTKRPDGTWSARTYIRDTDGKLASSSGAAAAAQRPTAPSRPPWPNAPRRPQNNLNATTRIRDLAERWYADVRQDVTDGTKSPNTARLYRHYLDRHILPGIGALRLSEATVPRVDEFITAVRNRSGTAAAKACRSALSSMLGQAARRGAIPTNPVRDIGRLPGLRRSVKARSLTLAECRRWIAQLEANPVAVRRDLPDLTRWLLATGVRIGEAIAVDWSSIDMDQRHGRDRLQDAARQGRGPPAGSPHQVRRRTSHPASTRVRRPHARTPRAASGGTGPLFPDSRGGWRDPINLSRELREARGSGEFSWVTSHVFRKTCATLLDEGELSARQIADQLGHAKVSMTQDNYLGRRLTNRRTAETLDRALGNTLG